MQDATFKDKPSSVHNALPFTGKQRRYAIVFALILFFWFFVLTPFSTRQDSSEHSIYSKNINWSKYAYSQYATDQHYLCNSLMVFDSLEKLGSTADRLLFYPRTWDTEVESSKDRISQLLVMARDKYHVKLQPAEMYTLKREAEDQRETWDASINKLYAWKQEHYDRVIHLDSDITLLQNIDELFFLPLGEGSPVAMPRAYWKLNDNASRGGGVRMTSLVIVLKPLPEEAKQLWDAAAGFDNNSYSALPDNALFDMELLNTRYINNAITIPHRPFAMVTGELRRKGSRNHTHYLGNSNELWDAELAIKEAKLVHFSDWPLPKPWIMWPNSLMREIRPECEINSGTPEEEGCENRKIWMSLYDDFRKRRKEVCRLLSVPAPEWPPRQRGAKSRPKSDGAGTSDRHRSAILP